MITRTKRQRRRCGRSPTACPECTTCCIRTARSCWRGLRRETKAACRAKGWVPARRSRCRCPSSGRLRSSSARPRLWRTTRRCTSVSVYLASLLLYLPLLALVLTVYCVVWLGWQPWIWVVPAAIKQEPTNPPVMRRHVVPCLILPCHATLRDGTAIVLTLHCTYM
jgi:hypothetical protein